ncbi:hypothetical protein AN477_07135 [Alicyclobacillus ferrooxydans]|uniref:Uncharacterized protein n=1 Tax=Alicyclobacillus ferrooxydans TaxID=471514 RepID=A0A0P9CFP8_9BACL|nr:hypothetical protein AN477_07135 [Alicyclobacillus ferrooxydans]
MLLSFSELIISECGKPHSFIFSDKKLGPLLFYIVADETDGSIPTGTLYCRDWGRDWRLLRMERNGEQWLYRFEHDTKVREYNLPRTFLEKIYEEQGIRIRTE